MRVVIIDNGGANIASLRFAFERLGCVPILSSDPGTVRDATHVVLPGVGAAADAMARLKRHGLADVVPALKQPVLGICLGMQLLFEYSAEGGATCLGALAGTATRMSVAPDRPVPHMGWNQLILERPSELLDEVRSGEYAYFVHSYALPVNSSTVASCEYGGQFSAVVERCNFYGTQFHPERSAATGACILANFLRLG
jgi:imidazole glycerol-phosphate synthase subunit HisH